MTTLPFALIGGFWLTYALGYNLSVTVAVGFIALVGGGCGIRRGDVIYIEDAIAAAPTRGRLISHADLVNAIIEGAVLRVRPKAMTVAVIVAGLLPIMLGSGTGSEVMQRIAAPMVGGMVTAPLLSLFVIPAIYLLWRRRRLARQ
jgi:Cu(I)/Ag(I) efflux system membrane protein CusA/SilA